MNVLLLLGTLIGIAGLSLAAILSFAVGARLRAAVLGVAIAAWTGLYVAGLIIVSLASHETVLATGTTKRFCGFYLDCHLGVAVQNDVLVPTIGDRRSSGSFHVITLAFSSNARRETLTPHDLRIEIVDASGRHYERDLFAEAALFDGTLGPLARPIRAGDSYSTPVVFDLPRGITEPRLFAGEGLGIDRVIEGALIGDEDSFLHRKVMLALPGRRDISLR